MNNDIEDTLKERNETHGDFEKNANLSQKIKDVFKNGNWEGLSPDKKEALEIIATKISRILSGDSEHADSWHDIAGYAVLVEKTLQKPSIKNNVFRSIYNIQESKLFFELNPGETCSCVYNQTSFLVNNHMDACEFFNNINLKEL